MIRKLPNYRTLLLSGGALIAPLWASALITFSIDELTSNKLVFTLDGGTTLEGETPVANQSFLFLRTAADNLLLSEDWIHATKVSGALSSGGIDETEPSAIRAYDIFPSTSSPD